MISMDSMSTMFVLTLLIIDICGIVYITKNFIHLVWDASYVRYSLENTDEKK